jgi:hypothetical protein
MQFTTHNQDATLDINGTHLQGHIDAKYSELVDLFGKPTNGDGYKVDAEWIVKFADGTLSTIYNYKTGKNYCGKAGKATEQITDWHVGGVTIQSLNSVQIAIDLHREMKAAEKPKDAVEEAFTPATEMMEMLKATKGKHYANTVELTMLTKKLGDLNHVLLLSLVETDIMPSNVAKALTKIHAQISSRMIALMMRADGREPTKQDGSDLMDWAQRLMDTEQDGVTELIKTFPKGEK